MKVYVAGNEDQDLDNRVYGVVEKIKESLPEIEWVKIKPNEDMPFENEKKVIILDTVQGLDEAKIIDDEALENTKSLTVHDYDLGWQLKYLRKLGKLGKVTIVGVPQTGKIDYDLIQSIFRKLVEQDMHGS